MEPARKPFPDLAEEAVRLAYAGVRKTRWDESRIRARFGARSARDIFSEGETHYMNPCLDLSLALAKILSEDRGFPTELVATAGEDARGPVGHFHLECRTPGGPWTVEQRSMGDVRILPADGRPADGWARRELRVPLGTGSFSLSPAEIFSGDAEISGIYGNYVRASVERIVRDNSPERWERFLETVSGRAEGPRIRRTA